MLNRVSSVAFEGRQAVELLFVLVPSLCQAFMERSVTPCGLRIAQYGKVPSIYLIRNWLLTRIG